MRTQRGVPLTAEQRGEGGNVAQSAPSAGGFGFNPNQGAAGTQWGSAGNQNFGQFGNFGQMLQALMQQYQPQEDVSQILETKARLRNPEEYARRTYMADTYAAPFAPGGAFEGRTAADTMTPAQIMASQGMSAKNQWASQLPAGSTTPSGVDTDELRKLNAQQAARYKTYM
jgi:hypothetical protein